MNFCHPDFAQAEGCFGQGQQSGLLKFFEQAQRSLMSCAVLAHPGQAGGVLLAAEISTLELAADLVCLSACGTAGGYRSPSEGVFGLTRAFLAAGARTVVSTWWEVEDTAARRFMELFYARLRDGYDRDEAARRARVAMHEEGYSSRDRAAFAVVGAVTGSLTDVLATGPNPPARTWLLAGAGIALIAAALGARLRARSQRARVG